MREVSIDERKKLQLKILESVNLFCQNNNIKYFLCGGTLLGAIRHKGYIPWDDDIDIGMDRHNYEKFIEIFGIPELELYHYKKKYNYELPFIKVGLKGTTLTERFNTFTHIGIHIDIFPFDGFSSNEVSQRDKIDKIQAIRERLFGIILDKNMTLRNDYVYPNTIKGNINKWKHMLKVKLFGGEKYFNKRIYGLLDQFNAIAMADSYEKSEFVGCSVWGYKEKEIISKKAVDELTTAEYEGNLYPIPKGYDEYLTSLYGKNYMQPPNKENIFSNHTYKAYIND